MSKGRTLCPKCGKLMTQVAAGWYCLKDDVLLDSETLQEINVNYVQKCPDCGEDMRSVAGGWYCEKDSIFKDSSVGVLRRNVKAGQLDDELAAATVKRKALFTEETSEDELRASIFQDMANLATHEAGSGWFRWGAVFSGNIVAQLLQFGFKSIVDQNKIIIRQNELILRQLRKLEKGRNSLSGSEAT